MRPPTFHAGELSRLPPSCLSYSSAGSPHLCSTAGRTTVSAYLCRDTRDPTHATTSSGDRHASLADRGGGDTRAGANGPLQARQPLLAVGEGGRHQTGCLRHGRRASPSTATHAGGGPAPGRPLAPARRLRNGRPRAGGPPAGTRLGGPCQPCATGGAQRPPGERSSPQPGER